MMDQGLTQNCVQDGYQGNVPELSTKEARKQLSEQR